LPTTSSSYSIVASAKEIFWETGSSWLRITVLSDSVGTEVGIDDGYGVAVGKNELYTEGWLDGCDVGVKLGQDDGCLDGCPEGNADG
jgi:hypothetical protein